MKTQTPWNSAACSPAGSTPGHDNDVIMSAIAPQITSLMVVYSTVYSDADQRKHQSSASLAFVWGINRDRWIPRTKGQLRGKCFHLMTSSWKTPLLLQQIIQTQRKTPLKGQLLIHTPSNSTVGSLACSCKRQGKCQTHYRTFVRDSIAVTSGSLSKGKWCGNGVHGMSSHWQAAVWDINVLSTKSHVICQIKGWHVGKRSPLFTHRIVFAHIVALRVPRQSRLANHETNNSLVPSDAYMRQ